MSSSIITTLVTIVIIMLAVTYMYRKIKKVIEANDAREKLAAAHMIAMIQTQTSNKSEDQQKPENGTAKNTSSILEKEPTKPIEIANPKSVFVTEPINKTNSQEKESSVFQEIIDANPELAAKKLLAENAKLDASVTHAVLALRATADELERIVTLDLPLKERRQKLTNNLKFVLDEINPEKIF